MQKSVIRKLWRLADRLAVNAEQIRNATRPWQLTGPKARAVRHLAELNRVRDLWADHYQPSRRVKFPRPPCSCDNPTFWQKRRMHAP